MNRCVFLCVVVWSLLIPGLVKAGDSLQRYPHSRHSEMLQQYRDSLRLDLFGEQYRAHLDSIWQAVSYEDPLNYLFPKDIELDGSYYKLYLPVTFYKEAVMRWYAPAKEKFSLLKPVESSSLLQVDDSVFSHFVQVNDFMNQHLFQLYSNNSGAIEKWDSKIEELKIYNLEGSELVKPKVSILDIFKPEEIAPKPEKAPERVGGLIKPRLWRTYGNGSINFSQLHMSDNWYQGGDNNMNLLGYFIINFNYKDPKGIQWDNYLEIREGLNTTPNDTLHDYQINTDLFRLNSKVGIKAINRWYYTFATQFTSQFFTNYHTNTMNKKSSLFSPGYLSVSLGMDYKLEKKKINLSVLMAPLTYNLNFVKDGDVDETKFGIERGKYSMHKYGSQIESRASWKIFTFLTYNGYLKVFTNYEGVVGNMENTFEFRINKYFTTSFFSQIRFDDNVKRKEDQSYFQFKDIFSFGVGYKW